MHDQNMFITLTYDEDHLPEGGSVKKSDFQRFIKQLRKMLYPKKIRYFHCGEYGENFARPHYHALIFGHRFDDLWLWFMSNEHPVYRSATLEELWPYGHSSIGEVTMQSAGYCARYVFKKIVGDRADDHYKRVDAETGEIQKVEPEYITMSNRPGIGKSWFDKYWRNVFPHDFVWVAGKKNPVPEYYDKLMERREPLIMDYVRYRREKYGVEKDDSSDDRLRQKRECAEDRLKQLARGYER